MYLFFTLLIILLIPVIAPIAVTKKPNSLTMRMVNSGRCGSPPVTSGADLASSASSNRPKAVAMKEKGILRMDRL